jgi:pilus assembly protein Flp/PilA
VRELPLRAWVWLGSRLRDESGATAVEYALMVALIALVVVGAVAFLGQETNSRFDNFSFTPPP